MTCQRDYITSLSNDDNYNARLTNNLSIEDIYNKKWKILFVTCLIISITTMLIDSPLLMQYMLETKYNLSTRIYLFLYIFLYLFSPIGRRISNNFRTIFSNKTATFMAFGFLIIAQTTFAFSFYFLSAFPILFLSRALFAFAQDPLLILMTSLVSKCFYNSFGNIPFIILLCSKLLGNLANSLLLPFLFSAFSALKVNFIYLVFGLGTLPLILLTMNYFYQIELINNAKENDISIDKRISDFTLSFEKKDFKFLAFSEYYSNFKGFSIDVYCIIIAGSLSYLHIFNFIFILNDNLISIYGYSSKESGILNALFYFLCLVLMPVYNSISKQVKNIKLNMLIVGNLCGVLAELLSIMKFNALYLVILMSFDFGFTCGIILECFPAIVDQERLESIIELNKVVQNTAIAFGALIGGFVITLQINKYFSFHIFLMISSSISIILLFKVKEHLKL